MTTAPKRGPGRPVSPALNERRRQEIISTAVRLFAERGYHATTLDDIARALGSTKGLIYHYFRSKADLADQSVRGSLHLMLRRLEAIAGSDLPPDEKLRCAIDDFVGAVLFGYQRYLVILADRAEIDPNLDDAYRRDHHEAVRRFVRLYRQIVVEGIDAGAFEPIDPSVASNTLIQGIVGVARWFRPDRRLSPERVRREVTVMLLRSIVRRDEVGVRRHEDWRSGDAAGQSS